MQSTASKALYNFKIKRAQETRHNQFFFQIFKTMRSLRPWKCLKRKNELTFTTQKANACSPWNGCSVFNWKYVFEVNFVQQLKIITLNWNFVHSLIKIYRTPWWCSLFLFATENTFMHKFSQKNQNLSVWAEISHLTNLNLQNYEENMWCSLFLF